MTAKSPEDICRLFQQYIAEGDLDAVLSVYDPEAVFLKQYGEVTRGRQELRQQLAAQAAMKTRFDFTIKQVVQAGDIALMHTQWQVSKPQPMTVYAIEVARRQPDRTWRWLIGDPFTDGNAHACRHAGDTAGAVSAVPATLKSVLSHIGRAGALDLGATDYITGRSPAG